MDEVLRTDRLLLRRLTMDDAADLGAILGDAVTMAHYPRPFTPLEVEAWIAKNLQRYRALGFGLWALVRLADGAFVGQCGPVPQNVEGTTEIELGWHVHRSCWRRGYASEAAAACMDHAFENLGIQRLVSLVLPANVASQGVARRIGMVPERLVQHSGREHLLFERDSSGPRDAVARTGAAYERITGRARPEETAEVPARARETFTARLGRGAIVADVGCGSGRDLTLLAEEGLRVVGFDLSYAVIRQAAAGRAVAVADLRRLPVRAGAFDGVWANASLLHVPKSELEDALREMARVLRPGGSLYLGVKRGEGEHWRVAEGEPRFFAFYFDEELDARLAGAGFEVVEAWTEADVRGREPWLKRIAQAASTSRRAVRRSGTTR